MSRRNTTSLAFIGLTALILAAAVLAACGESEDRPGTTGEPVTTTAAVSTTEGAVVPTAPDVTIEAGGLEWRRANLTGVGYSGMRIVGTADGFFALGYKIDEGEITTWSSQDGLNWKEMATDTEALLPGEFVMEVVATPTGYLATGGEAEWWWGEGPVDRMWTSADGATWIRKDFDLADVARLSPYVTGEGTVLGMAAGPTELVLAGQSVFDLDHQAILDEIAPGADMGEMMIGVGENPPGTASVEYGLEEGMVRVTFAQLGLPDSFLNRLGTQSVGVWHSSDGSSWASCPEAAEWDIQEYAPNLVGGPNGYLIDAGDMLYVSPDAENWSAVPAETAFGVPTGIYEGHVTGWADGWAAIVAAGMIPREGPVEGTDFFTEQKAILTSPDGAVWSEALVPTSMQLTEGAASLERLFGGEFGLFAYLDVESEEPNLGGAELWWSTDAETWDPIQVSTTFGPDRVLWDLTISTDRAIVLAADWTGWQDEDAGNVPFPLEVWVATAT